MTVVLRQHMPQASMFGSQAAHNGPSALQYAHVTVCCTWLAAEFNSKRRLSDAVGLHEPHDALEMECRGCPSNESNKPPSFATVEVMEYQCWLQCELVMYCKLVHAHDKNIGTVRMRAEG